MKFIALIFSSPTENATSRMRAWRALKTSGAAILRDGVYLMPERSNCRAILEAIAADVITGGGTAYLFRTEEPEGANLMALFNRSEDYAVLLDEVAQLREALTSDTALETIKQTRKLRKIFTSLAEIDFFPGAAHNQADTALQDLELATAHALTVDEPQSIEGIIPRLDIKEYTGRIWATRRRPWVDRLACAWLIRRFIDSQARLLWLASPAECPDSAIGFDFDGATFSHIGARVTFEVLLISFSFESPALRRLGALVHYLDVGGIQPPETVGVENILVGLRETILDDDQFLAAANNVFNGLLATFEKDVS